MRTVAPIVLLPLLAAGCTSLTIDVPSYTVPAAPSGGEER